MAKKRVTIPKADAARVLFSSDRTCCVCRKTGKRLQIHHIDDDPSNNEVSNLAVLCFECHGETQITGGFGRQLDADQVRLYRDNWHRIVAIRRVQNNRDTPDKVEPEAIADKDRQSPDDKARWLPERYRINSQLLREAICLERDLWNVASFLDADDRDKRMPGHTTILLTPQEGLPGIFDEDTRAILVEAVEDAFSRLDSMELLVAEVALIGTPEQTKTARALHEALWDVTGLLEAYASFHDAADAVEAVRRAKDQFAEAARSSLRVEGESIPIDRRPRLDVNLQ
jgi:hypothetical protein